jgi:putative transposase
MPQYPEQGFESLDHARKWVKGFVHWYNKQHYNSGVHYVIPHDIHIGKANGIMAQRQKIYEAARNAHTEEWTTNTRKWEVTDTVALNPAKEHEHQTAEKNA